MITKVLKDKMQVLIGNVTGIYDMSGGACEYVAAYIDNSYVQSGQDSYTYGQSLIDSVNAGNTKYADIYSIGSSDSYSNNYTASDPNTSTGHYGDAVWETSNSAASPYTNSWYSDYSRFSHTTYPFFIRGGTYSGTTDAGTFYFDYYTGNSDSIRSFRIVISTL